MNLKCTLLLEKKIFDFSLVFITSVRMDPHSTRTAFKTTTFELKNVFLVIMHLISGLFIFLFRCALYPEALRCWRFLVLHNTFNPRRTPGNTAIKNNTNTQSQKITSSKCALSSNHQPLVSMLNASYIPDDVNIKGSQQPAIKNNKYEMNSYQMDITTWGEAMEIRNVTRNNIKPTNYIEI